MTPTEGANMHDPLIREHPLPGGVTATVVTFHDLEGTITAAQLTVSDEPLDADTLRALADELGSLARALDLKVDAS